MIFFDYRFTTTAGTLVVEINGTPIASIPAPDTVQASFSNSRILVNETRLMGLNDAVLTLRLDPGSFADILLRGIFSPSFDVHGAAGGTETIAQGTLLCARELFDADFQESSGSPSVSTAGAGSRNGSDSASALSTAVSVSTPFFGGVQWTAAAAVEASVCDNQGEAFLFAETQYGLSGNGQQPPDVDFQLKLTGSIDLRGDFSQPAMADVRLPISIETPRALIDDGLFSNLVRITVRSETAQADWLIPGDPNGTSIRFTSTTGPGGIDVSRRYDVAINQVIDNILYGLVNEGIIIRVGDDDEERRLPVLKTSADASFGIVVADFSDTFEGSLSTDTPGVQLMQQPSGMPADDGDGIAAGQDLCPATPPGRAVNSDGCSAGQLDVDGDAVSNASDTCPFYVTSDIADRDFDDRGDACECTDQNGDGRNTVADGVAISTAIFNPVLATPLCDGNNDGTCNVSDIIASTIEILSPANTSICTRQPVPGP
jgi:hypothetical protein